MHPAENPRNSPVRSDFLLVAQVPGQPREWVQARVIDDTLAELATLRDRFRKDRNRAGYFAAVCTRLTVLTRDAIAAHEFSNGARMERLLVALTRRYIDTCQNRQNAATCWQLSFQAAADDRWLTVPQHVLLGWNAYLNYDLPIAVGRNCPAIDLPEFHGDYQQLCEIISTLIQRVFEEMIQIWPALGWTAPMWRGPNDELIRFSPHRAMENAWHLAGKLAGHTLAEQTPLLANLDRELTAVAHRLRHPGLLNLPLRQ